MQESLDSLPPLCLKPEHISSEILFSTFSTDLVNYISFRSLNLETDIDLIYDWVNKPYAIEFWQMNGPKDRLIETYSSVIACPHAHSFVGLLGSKPVCQIDVYRVLADELSSHIPVSTEACGMHLLMAPKEGSKKGLTKLVVSAFLKFYFSFPMTSVMYAEPDKVNHKAKRVLEDLGFEYLREVELSSKTASLYMLQRQRLNTSFF